MQLDSTARSGRLSRLANPALLCLCALLLPGAMAWAAAPSQTPLLSRIATPPTPNMMITVDDSGSMQTNFIPEGAQTLNGKTVTLPSQYNPLAQYFQDVAYGDPTHSAYGGSSGTVQAVKGSTNVYQRQYRSANVNRIYYDPTVRYLPWYKADTSGDRMAAATASTAYWEVTNTGDGSFNLTANKTGTNGITTTWWTGVTTSSYSKKDWYPGLYYVLTSGADPTVSGSYTEYDVNATDGSHAPGTKSAARTDCAGSKCTKAEELQNFANWFVYYRSRILLTKAALSQVVGNNSGNSRFGLASINHTGVMRLGVKDFSADHRKEMLSKLQGMAARDGTPLKAAVQAVGSYFQGGSTLGNPWRTDPSNSSSALLSCRRSYNILMTDGYYNNDPITGLPGNLDNADGPEWTLDLSNQTPLPPTHYVKAKPYQDNIENTLADFAMAYYINDLQTSLANKVVPTTGDLADPAYWQHLNMFTVGLGVSGTLPASTEAQRKSTLAEIVAGTKSWPNPGVGGDTILAAKIDDLWHAAVDTRGDFFLANNATELTDALNEAVGRAAGVNRVEAGLVASSRSISSSTLKFVPSYQSGAWWGDLKAYPVVSNNGVLGFSATESWRASDQLPAPASRNILTWTGSAGALFDTSLSTTLKNQIVTGSTQDAMINFLRGDTSNEGSTSSSFRQRNGKKLPDFINGTPTYVKGLVNLGYTWNNYADYVATKKARTTGLVFVGGNGGMLHGFRDTTGVEVVAYVPKSVYPKLATLAAQDYGSTSNFHQFYVDGPLVEADAYIATNKATTGWANLLIGALGAGGTGIFGLDVTDQSSFNAANVLFEVNSGDNADIGYIYNEPAVGRLNGKWFAFFGNGANSSNGRSVLFAIDLETRALSSVVLDTGTGGGAMGVKLIQNSAKEVQGAYVGDLKGNLWRVEFGGSYASANWSVAFNGKPLFIATDNDANRQPITVAPATVTHYKGGTMVLFGTGKLIDSTDPDLKSMQSYYGVWDQTPIDSSAAASTNPAWASQSKQRSGLQAQTITQTPVTGGDGDSYFKMSANTVNWNTQRGWYMDLTLPTGTPNASTASGQRVLYKSVPIGEFVTIYTVVPGAQPASCETATGTGYNFLVPALTGGLYSKPVIDTNGDGVVNDSDAIVAGYATEADGSDTVFGQTSLPDESNFVTGTSKQCNTTECKDLLTYCINNGCTKARMWRQLLNPPHP